VWLYASNGKTHQDVYLQHEGKGFYSVWIMGTGKVLELRGGSILPGANIVQWSYDGTDKQLWAMRKNADGITPLVAAHYFPQGRILRHHSFLSLVIVLRTCFKGRELIRRWMTMVGSVYGYRTSFPGVRSNPSDRSTGSTGLP